MSEANECYLNAFFIKYGFILSRHRDDTSVDNGEMPNKSSPDDNSEIVFVMETLEDCIMWKQAIQ